jgi:hypothetical protein
VIRCVVQFDGDLLRELQNLGREAKPRAKRIIQTMCDQVTLRARELAPDDEAGPTPDLRLSIRNRVQLSKGGVRGSVIAGGTELDAKLAAQHRKNPGAHEVYAVVQHEDTTLHHSHGQANFIGQPFMSHLPGMAEQLEKELLSARA